MDKRQQTPYKRRELLSNPRPQLVVIAVFGIIAVLFSATNCYVSKNNLQVLANNVLQLPLSDANRADAVVMVRQQTANLDIQLMVFTFLAFIVLLLGGVALSHKMAGPVYQLTKYCRDVAAARTSVRGIRFRKYDFFHELAASFNEFQRSRGILPSPPDEREARSQPGDSAAGP